MKQFTLLQLFTVIDGRLSTDIGDVYEILNAYTDDSLMTHHLPVAMDYLKLQNPDWFKSASLYLQGIKSTAGDDFNTLIEEILYNHATQSWIVTPMPESEREAFGNYMIENSLLLRKLKS
jgi:hypothetical protein